MRVGELAMLVSDHLFLLLNLFLMFHLLLFLWFGGGNDEGGGNLFELLCKTPEGYFPEEVARFYGCEVLMGLERMHKYDFH